MAAIALIHPLYTNLKTLIETLASATGCTRYSDSDIIEQTAVDHGLSLQLIDQVIQVAPIAFDTFTHEREKVLASLEKTLATQLKTGHCLFSGLICQLIPHSVTHVLRIRAISDNTKRLQAAVQTEGCSASQANDFVNRADDLAMRWSQQIKTRGIDAGPDSHLILDMDAGESVDRQADRILAALKSAPFSGQTPRQKEVADLNLITDIQMALADLGGGMTVSTHEGEITVTLDRKQMNLPQTQARIKTAIKSIPGVVSLKIKIGPRYYESEMIRTFDFESSAGPWKWGGGNEKH